MPINHVSTVNEPHDEIHSHSPADSMEEEQQATEDIASLSSNTSNPHDERERKVFAIEIHKFMAEIGKPLSKIPIMGYKELDLYQLFKEVTAHGGFNEVVKNVGTWSKIWKRLGNFDPSITDSSFRLKKNYERYLLEYEYRCFPEHRLSAMELAEKSSMKRSGSNNGLANLARPHSPTNSHTSSSAHGSPYSSNPNASNTSASNQHNSPEAYSTKDRKMKAVGKKKLRKSTSKERINPIPRDTPPRSASWNSLRLADHTTDFEPLSLENGDLYVEKLGTIIPRYPFIDGNNIWPIGYVSYRYFKSRINPEKQVRYTSQILCVDDRPQFTVTAEDEPDNIFISHESPSAVWRKILEQFVSAEYYEHTSPFNLANHNMSSSMTINKISVSGRYRFGLTHPEVVVAIRELPNYDMIGPMSPSSKRKYTNISDDSDDSKMKAKRETNTADDLESAVATLQALKYCSVF